MHLKLLAISALFVIGAHSKCSWSGDPCKWHGTAPQCAFINPETTNINDTVNGWQLKAWIKEGGLDNLCLIQADPANCCEEYGSECLSGSMRLWCKESSDASSQVTPPRHLSTRSCPPGEAQLEKMTKPLMEEFQKRVCDKGITVGGSKDVSWIMKNVYPYYTSKKFLGKELPDTRHYDVEKILKKCHKSTYNYCNAGDREKFSSCIREFAAELVMKYSMQVPGFCPVVDKIVNEWPEKYEAEALKKISKYVAWKEAGN